MQSVCWICWVRRFLALSDSQCCERVSTCFVAHAVTGYAMQEVLPGILWQTYTFMQKAPGQLQAQSAQTQVKVIHEALCSVRQAVPSAVLLQGTLRRHEG